jgi:hypothetical protein
MASDAFSVSTQEVIENVSAINQVLTDKVSVLTDLAINVQTTMESLLQSSIKKLGSVSSIIESRSVTDAQKVIEDLVTKLQDFPSIIDQTVGSLSSRVSNFVKSLPATLLSSLPSGLGTLPSLVSTLPSQLSSLLPGGLESIGGIAGAIQKQKELVPTQMPKVLSGLISPQAFSLIRGKQSAAAGMTRPQLAESSKQMEGMVDTTSRRPQFYDKFDPTTEFKMRSYDLDAEQISLESDNRWSKEEDLRSIQEGLEIILGEEFNQYGGRADLQSEIVSGNSDKSIRPYKTDRDGENLHSLKRAFEEILTREYRKYGGTIQ